MLIMSKENVTKLKMCSDLLIDKMCFKGGFKDSCSEDFVIFVESICDKVYY